MILKFKELEIGGYFLKEPDGDALLQKISPTLARSLYTVRVLIRLFPEDLVRKVLYRPGFIQNSL